MRQEKHLLLDEIAEQLTRSKSMITVRYQGFNANLMSGFRSELMKAGGSFEVVKKRVFLKAASSAGISVDPKTLQGHIGLVFIDGDLVGLTKTLSKFIKENEEIVKVVFGRIEGQNCSPSEIAQIATLPSKEQMRAEVLGLLEAVPSQLLGTIEALLTSVPHCLENKIQKEQTN